MPSSVVLQYKREGQLSSGRIVRRIIDTDKPIQLAVTEETIAYFEQIEYGPMINTLCVALRTFPEANAVIERTDRPGLVPYVFDESMVKLMREDPVTAIRSLQVPEQTVNMKAAKPQGEATFIQPTYIKAGYDTFAESFGYEVYLSARGGTDAECPCCGRWSRVGQGRLENKERGLLVCTFMRCQVVVPVVLHTPTWVSVQLMDLLQQKTPRFYLPRAWNEGRAWVDFEVLKDKYKQFLTEVASCSDKAL